MAVQAGLSMILQEVQDANTSTPLQWIFPEVISWHASTMIMSIFPKTPVKHGQKENQQMLESKNWTFIASSANGITLLACATRHCRKTNTRESVWVSTDFGGTWTKHEPAGTGIEKPRKEVSMSSDGSKMIACAESDFVYLSYDGGKSWVDSNPAGDTKVAWNSAVVSGNSFCLLVEIPAISTFVLCFLILPILSSQLNIFCLIRWTRNSSAVSFL